MSSPASATSSPKTRIRSSAFICSNSTCRIASPIPIGFWASVAGLGAGSRLARQRFGSGIVGQCQHLIGHRRRVRPGGLQNLPADGGDQGTHAVADLDGLGAGEHPALDQLALEADDRVVGRLFREVLGERYFDWESCEECEYGPGHRRMDQAGPLAGPHPRRSPSQRRSRHAK